MLLKSLLTLDINVISSITANISITLLKLFLSEKYLVNSPVPTTIQIDKIAFETKPIIRVNKNSLFFFQEFNSELLTTYRSESFLVNIPNGTSLPKLTR